jgi:hypothetical protein
MLAALVPGQRDAAAEKAKGAGQSPAPFGCIYDWN